jgi:pimeloyl-ACP methyl ester carboxylesterase
MPVVSVRGAALNYEEHGRGPEAVVFAHGLLLCGRQFDGLIDPLSDRYRCIVYDARGHGQSEVTANGYDLDDQTEDAAALVCELGCGPCHFVGFSMGGFVGQRLAVRHPELVRSLTLVGSSAGREPNGWKFRLMGLAARLFGLRALTSSVMPVQFGPDFLRDPSRATERKEWFERIAANNLAGVLPATDAVIRRPDFTPELSRVRVPTLVVVGETDLATPPAEARRLHAGIADSELVVVSRAGHAVTIEQPGAVATALRGFLERQDFTRRGQP